MRLLTSSPVLRLLGGRDQARDGGGHLPAQLPVLPGSDPGLCGHGASDLSGGWGPGSDVLFKPDVIRGLPVLLPLRGLPAAPPWGWATRKRDPAAIGAHLGKRSNSSKKYPLSDDLTSLSHTHTHPQMSHSVLSVLTYTAPTGLASYRTLYSTVPHLLSRTNLHCSPQS